VSAGCTHKVDAIASALAVVIRYELEGEATELERSLADLEAAPELEQRI
jgi:hypothetical protein